MKTGKLFDNQAIESFDKLKEFIEKNDFVDSKGEYTYSIHDNFQEIMELMDFKYWITLDTKREKNKVWIHPNGFYAVECDDGMRINLSSVCIDQEVTWMKGEHSKLSYPTEHGYKVIDSLIELKDFSTIKSLYGERLKLKNVVPVSEWTVEMFLFMSSRFSINASDFAKAIELNKNNDVFHSESFDKYVEFFNSADSNLIRITSALNKDVYFTLYEIFRGFYINQYDEPHITHKEEIKILAEYLRGNPQIDWRQVKDICDQYSGSPPVHPLELKLLFMTKLHARSIIKVESKDFIEEGCYPQIKEICQSISLDEAKSMWNVNCFGQTLFQNIILINLRNMETFKFLLEQLKENVGLSFISDEVFNFRHLYKDEKNYKRDLSIALIDNDNRINDFEDIFQDFFKDYPEFFKSSSKNKSFVSNFLKNLSENAEEDTSIVLHKILEKIWKESLLQKNLTPSSLNSPFKPRF